MVLQVQWAWDRCWTVSFAPVGPFAIFSTLPGALGADLQVPCLWFSQWGVPAEEQRSGVKRGWSIYSLGCLPVGPPRAGCVFPTGESQGHPASWLSPYNSSTLGSNNHGLCIPLPTLARVLTSQSTAFVVSPAYDFEDDPFIKLSPNYPNLSVSAVSCRGSDNAHQQGSCSKFRFLGLDCRNSEWMVGPEGHLHFSQAPASDASGPGMTLRRLDQTLTVKLDIVQM